MFVILGATDKVGRRTIAELRRAGAPVRAIVRDREAEQDLEASGFEIAVADIRDSDALGNAMLDATAVHAPDQTNDVASEAVADGKRRR